MTTIKDLINVIKSYEYLELGWDGYSGEAPSKSSINDAIIFIENNLNDSMILPQSMCSGDEVAIFWENEINYLEIGFAGDNKYSYFLINWTDVIEIYNVDIFTIPEEIKNFLKNLNF